MTCDVWRVTCDVWRMTCDVWRVTCDFACDHRLETGYIAEIAVEAGMQAGSTCDVWRVTCDCDVWRVTCDVWRMTCDVWRVTCDVWRVTCCVWPNRSFPIHLDIRPKHLDWRIITGYRMAQDVVYEIKKVLPKLQDRHRLRFCIKHWNSDCEVGGGLSFSTSFNQCFRLSLQQVLFVCCWRYTAVTFLFFHRLSPKIASFICGHPKMLLSNQHKHQSAKCNC
jgi:hypothetical protein